MPERLELKFIVFADIGLVPADIGRTLGRDTGACACMESQLLINYLIQKIVLFDDRAEIYYNTPTDTTPGDGRGILLYTIGKDYTAYSATNEGRKKPKHLDIDIKI